MSDINDPSVTFEAEAKAAEEALAATKAAEEALAEAKASEEALAAEIERMKPTAEEEAQRDVMQAELLLAEPLEAWKQAMLETDTLMTRDVEDLIDNLIFTEILTEEQLSTRLAEYRALKKTERNKKPV